MVQNNFAVFLLSKISFFKIIRTSMIQADDDTYMVLENLHHLLKDCNTSEPLWFGSHYYYIIEPMGYMQGGAGYVLSREALDRFVEKVNKIILLRICSFRIFRP
jgi:hypothetical protein